MGESHDERRDEILRALVEEHIRSGEAVSSKRILDTTLLNLSGATIRNELASLEREGFAVQPHTSAGRIPTAKAYRYYIDHIGPARLRLPAQQRIHAFFSSVHLELGRLLKAATELLSEITRYPSLAIGPGMEPEHIRALRLVPLGPQTILLVVVTQAGRVCNEVCTISGSVSGSEVEQAEKILMEVAAGAELRQKSLTVRDDISRGVRSVVDAALAGVGRLENQDADLYIGGAGCLASVWDNLTAVNRVLDVLQGEARVLELMAKSPGTAIQIGSEMGLEPDADLAMVSTSFEFGGEGGRVGVIGPMRMDYKKVISAVESVSRELDGLGS